MDHRQYIEQYLSPDVDGALDTAEQQEVSAHLATCADCRQRQAEERAIKTLLRQSIPTVRAPAELRQSIIASLDLEDARMAVRGRRFSRRPLLVGSVAAAAVAVAAIVLFMVISLSRPPSNPAFDSAVRDYVKAQQSFAANSALSSPADLAVALSSELGYPFVWDFSALGLSMTGARIDHRPDGQVVAYSLYKGKAGSILCISFRKGDLIFPPGGEESHGVRFYNYGGVWIGVVNYGRVFCYFVTHLTPAQMLPALIHSGPRIGSS
jgi:anti-sigma factor RsiW